MALPESRDLTLATGTQIPSTLLNNVQDAIISFAAKQTYIPASPSWYRDLTGTIDWIFSEAAGGWATVSTDTGAILIPIDGLNSGKTLLSVSIFVRNNVGADTPDLSVVRRAHTGTALTDVEAAVPISVGAGWKDLDIDPDHSVDPATYSYYIKLDEPGTFTGNFAISAARFSEVQAL